ncbi:MAG: extracellular solute-binding protein [Firmicutes bacterium]|nr:extracellular solute-binding protein [Bacillota bacterium]
MQTKAKWAVSSSAALLLVSALGAFQGSVAQAAGKTVITVAYEFSPGSTTNPIGTFLNKMAKEFEATHPNVIVKPQEIIADEGAYYTKLDLEEQSPATAPNVVMQDTFLISSSEQAGYLTNLTPYVDKWSQWKEFYPAFQKITEYDGKIWGISNGTDDRYLWYNKVLFKKAGLPVPWHPKNWAQVLAAARTIKKKLPKVIPMNVYSGVPMDEAATMQGFEMLLYGTGYTLYDYHDNKWVVKSPGFLHSLQFIQTLYRTGLGPSLGQALNSDMGTVVADTLLPKSELAIDLDGMWLPGSWDVKGSSSYWPQWSKVLGWTPMPTENGQAPGLDTLSGGWSWAISAKSANKNLSWQLIELMTDKQNMALYDHLVVNLSPRMDSATLPIYKSTAANYAFSTSLLPHTFFRPAFPAYAKISVQIDTAMENVMTGQMTPQQAMNAYAQAVTRIVGAAHVEALNHPETPAQLRP